MIKPFLHISGISAGYAGETYGLIGLNGAGKTTLLKTILGLKDQSAGRVDIGGSKAGSTAAQKQLSFLPERFDPAWFLSAYEFIDFTLSLYGRKAVRSEVDALADGLGLKKEYLSKRAQTYSKGMRQKLGLMATFLTGCPLLILDEPMSGLDPLARSQVKALVSGAREQGRTTFLSSHILSDMEELCDRIAILHGGNIVFTGTPAALLKQVGESHLENAFLALIGQNMPRAA